MPPTASLCPESLFRRRGQHVPGLTKPLKLPVQSSDIGFCVKTFVDLTYLFRSTFPNSTFFFLAAVHFIQVYSRLLGRRWNKWRWQRVPKAADGGPSWRLLIEE